MSEERYRLVVLGSNKVGKTNLIRRYLYNEFSEKYKETVEDLHSRQFHIKTSVLNDQQLEFDLLDLIWKLWIHPYLSSHRVQLIKREVGRIFLIRKLFYIVLQGVSLLLDILDTNFNFPDMRKVSITSANAFLLVFAVDDVPSFKEMSDIWQEICERRPDIMTLPVVVVGNKCDLPSKKIFEDTAKAFTSRLNADVRYLEVSAKCNIRVTDIFRTLLELSGFPRCSDILFIELLFSWARDLDEGEHFRKLIFFSLKQCLV
ncbi:Ras family protein [Dictyocaulus viviparus]|uniref:Ras family protein n=1 Tax=Dictyocaulus viviparus TaxID=29172 RepID=A0A0D8X869_DICVI|nr:Ras family protein [Dictyocaulus viviparus]